MTGIAADGGESPSPLRATTWYSYSCPIVTSSSTNESVDRSITEPSGEPSRISRYPLAAAPLSGGVHRSETLGSTRSHDPVQSVGVASSATGADGGPGDRVAHRIAARTTRRAPTPSPIASRRSLRCGVSGTATLSG